jgi:hypothetical protein
LCGTTTRKWPTFMLTPGGNFSTWSPRYIVTPRKAVAGLNRPSR